MDAREIRGQEIARSKRLSKRGNTWLVPSQSGRGKYMVLAGKVSACSCPDFETRGEPCKHIHAVKFAISETLNADGSRTVTKTVKVTYRQDWPAYNAAQTTEKTTFATLLVDMLKLVDEPPQGKGRPRLPLRDTLFAATYKVYSTVSARRFMVDLAEAEQAGHISVTPHFNSVLNIIEDPAVTPVLKSLVEVAARPLAGLEQDFAIDSSGFSTCGYVRWFDAKYGEEHVKKDWLKAHIVCGVRTNVVTAVEITSRFEGDAPLLPALVNRTAESFTVRELSADKAYLSTDNLAAIADVGAKALIPFKVNSVPGNGVLWDRAYHFFSLHRERFLKSYHKRSNVESTFAMIKAKFGAKLRSKTPTAQVNEALLKVLCHNICCLIAAMHELGVEPSFTA